MSPVTSPQPSVRSAPEERVRFTAVTELPGGGATPEQLAMLYTRYHWAAGLCRDREVLEVACGTGLGLGLLAKAARRVIGGDYDPVLLQQAHAHYGARVPLVQLDGHELPFRAQSFDAVILLEAVYYLPRPQHFLREARRVLRPGGLLLICSANREWRGFAASALSHHYPSTAELEAWLTAAGFVAQIHAAFPTATRSARDRVITVLRLLAVRWRLIPGTLVSRERLKRAVYGRLSPLPMEVEEGMTEASPLVPVDAQRPLREFKVLYAMGRLR